MKFLRMPCILLTVVVAIGAASPQASAKTTKHRPVKKTTTVLPADARANPFIQGNASPPLPAGPPGKVAVIASGSLAQLIQPGGPESLVIPVVVRNNTKASQSGIHLTATARSNGKLVGTGDSQGNFQPLTIKSGQIAIGYVFFQSLPPTTAAISYSVTTGSSITYDINLPVTESNTTPVAGGYLDLIGQVKNNTKKTLSPGPEVYGICFNSAGQPTGQIQTGTDGTSIPAGGLAPFSGQVSGANTPCVSWLITANGSTL